MPRQFSGLFTELITLSKHKASYVYIERVYREISSNIRLQNLAHLVALQHLPTLVL